MAENPKIEAGSPCVAVVMAAYNARTTVAAALASALDQPEVAEVVLVDDGSSDGTAAAAHACDDGSGRLRVLSQANGGPSLARNLGVRAVTSPAWCILDADDLFEAGRLGRLLSQGGEDWDMLSDGIRFAAADGSGHEIRPVIGAARELTLAEFVRGNIPRRNAPRRELGFLQPLMRTAFFRENRLEFDVALRLAEDYALFAEALALGARFRAVDAVGYVANITPGSLTHVHGAEDFDVLVDFDQSLAAKPGLSADDRAALAEHAHLMRLKSQYLKVEAALAQGRSGQALRLALRDHHTVGYMFNHRYRAGLARGVRRLLGKGSAPAAA